MLSAGQHRIELQLNSIDVYHFLRFLHSNITIHSYKY